MTTTAQTAPKAWEPLTPRGVARFARASFGRLFLVQVLVAVLTAAAIVWFLDTGWFPVIRDAVQRLPAQGDISHGRLHWLGQSPSPVQLAQNRFLGLAVDLYHSGQLGREAHLQVEFGEEDFRIYSLLGYQVLPYPDGLQIAFNQTELEPWWGAWHPYILVIAAALTALVFWLNWLLLATLYCAPARVISFLENRDLNWAQSWRLASAAQLPGALFFVAGMAGYGFGWMDLIHLFGMAALSFVIGWIYLLISPLFGPVTAPGTKASANPFAASQAANPEPGISGKGEK